MPPEIPEARVCHLTAGRLRLRVQAKKGNSTYFEKAGELLSRLRGIETVRVSPGTGSIIITFTSGQGEAVAEIAGYGQTQGLFSLKDHRPPAGGIHQGITAAFGEVDRKIRSVMGNEMDAAAIAFLSLAGMGIYQISRGNFAAPAWYTAFWYSMNIFLKSQPGKGGKSEL